MTRSSTATASPRPRAARPRRTPTDQLIKQTIGGVDKVTSFDTFGNLTQAADNANAYTSYAFDEANRLTTITPPIGSAATFTMDPLDRHATRVVGAAIDT